MTEPASPIVGNSIYYNGKNGIMSEPITKVGRKYFYTEPSKYRTTKWSLDSLEEVSDYGGRRGCHLSCKSLEDSNESEEISKELHKIFDWYARNNLTIDQLRRIKSIIGEDKS